MPPEVKLHAITFDCRDVPWCAAFWSQVLGRSLDDATVEGFATIGMGAGHPFYVFQPLSHESEGLNRVHPDFAVADLTAERVRLLGLGATVVAEVQENGVEFTTFADPEGNKFDVIAEEHA